MKINGSSLFLIILTVILSAFTAASEGGHFRNRCQAVSDCYVCDGPVYSAGPAYHHGHLFGRQRPMPAPVYFANTYPEYLNGSPNIYAGFDEYDQDVAYVVPARGKSPFKYNYWNDQYENTPYYGKQWDKNWTISGNQAPAVNAPNNAAPVENETITTPEEAPKTEAAPKSDAKPAENADEIPSVTLDNDSLDTEEDVFAYSPVEGSYQGHFIYNFESFCDDQECCLLAPLANAFHALIHCPCSGLGCHPSWNNPCADNGCIDSCCLDGGCFNGGCLNGGCLGGCLGKCLNNCCLANDEAVAEGDLCADIYVDPCCNVPPDINYPTNAPVAVPAVTNSESCVITTPVAPTAAVPQTTANNPKGAPAPQSSARDTPQNAAQGDKAAPQNAAPAKTESSKENQEQQEDNGEISTGEEDDISIPEMKTDESNEEGAFPAPNSKMNRSSSSKESSVAIRQFSDDKNGYIQISVPENAVVFINDYQTKMTGKNRTFVAKDLVPGEVYPFEIRVVVEANGQVYAGIKETSLTAGNSSSVAFQSRDFTVEKRVASR